MNGLKLVLKEHKNNFSSIFKMALKDLQKQYSGTAMGYSWAIIKDVIFVFAYWFTIHIGLKGSANVGYPYMAWLVVGLAGWFFIRDTFLPGAKSIRQNKFLVTKMIYPVSIIPTFKVISSFISSLMFMGIVLLVLICSGIKVDVYWLQVIYYQFAAIFLMVGISLLTSTLVVFSRDIEMLIGSVVFMLFWFTPILFPVSNLSGILAVIIKMNPFYYIVDGFRASFLYGQWFWERPILTLYFWVFSIGVFLLGSFMHGKLRNQFSDVL